MTEREAFEQAGYSNDWELWQAACKYQREQGEPVVWVREFWYQATPESIPELEREYFSSQVDGAVPLYTSAPAIPEGWQLVPIEPTKEMIDAARDQHEGEKYLPVSLYKAMLAAAPKPEDE